MASLVFTSLDRAITSSKTWGEFRKKIGPEEYAALYQDRFYTPEPDDDPEDIDVDALEPSDDAPFNSDKVPGFTEGDYPPWLAQEIDEHLPREILERFAKYDSQCPESSFLLYKILSTGTP
jgi:hypothetical protein